MERFEKLIGDLETGAAFGVFWVMILELRADDWKMAALFGIIMLLFWSDGSRRSGE